MTTINLVLMIQFFENSIVADFNDSLKKLYYKCQSPSDFAFISSFSLVLFYVFLSFSFYPLSEFFSYSQILILSSFSFHYVAFIFQWCSPSRPSLG
jgi:hypothetical protein